MRKKLVYICSPCRGEVEKNIIKAQGYCREAVELFPDVIPIAPHVYFTQFLNELEPAERAEGMEMGIALLDMCSEIWVYGMDNPSEGMKAEIEYVLETFFGQKLVPKSMQDKGPPLKVTVDPCHNHRQCRWLSHF